MKLFAKLTDGQLITTCADLEDTDLIAQILADGFKPYDDSATMPEIEEDRANAHVNPDVAAPKVIDQLASVAKPDTEGLREAAPDEFRVIDSTNGDLAASGSKSDAMNKLATPSLAEPVPTYRDDGDRIVLCWEIVENSPAKVAAEIARLRSELAATDYRIVKSYEYALAGQQPPYDITIIHNEREAVRDRIRELEGLL
jgi:hypothetical protein